MPKKCPLIVGAACRAAQGNACRAAQGNACRAAHRPTRQSRPTRPGFTVLELTITLGVLAVMLLVVGQSVALVAQQRRITQRRELAARTAENVMERVFAKPWNELNTEQLAEVKLPEDVKRDLPGAALKLDVTELEGPPRSRRIQVEVAWKDAAGLVAKPARLVAWRVAP